MDFVTALSLGSSVITFVQAGATVLKTAKQIHDSADGLSEDTRTRHALVNSMVKAVEKLKENEHEAISSDSSISNLVVECDNVSKKIQACLQKIEQSRWAKDELEELEKKLDLCGGQLQRWFDNLQHTRSAKDFDNLSSLIQKDQSKFDQLHASINQLIRGVEQGYLTRDTKAQLEDLLGISNNARIQHRILQSLRFEGMGQRYEDVENHHDEIFKWVFEGDGELDNDEWVTESDLERRLKMRNQARDRFLTWLSSPTEIFHISGKLGSGKSTLMKYLYSSPSTRDQVKKWARSKKVVFANFFFWKPGSKLQRSLDGLFRSLLHDILDAAWPTLAREVLHEYWVKAEQTPWQVPIKLDIPFNAVKEALEKIIEGKQHEARHLCFCFFIDGLDEYDDDLKIQQDRTFLVDLLHSWNKISSGNLMVCVSSREDTVFMDAFPPDRRLRLHDLTSHDMWSYTRDALAKFPNEAVKNRLLQIIPNRAEGIFLWTSLVIKNIREILPEGDSINHELDEILDELPSGLEELVQRILQSLSKRDQRKAYRTVALLQAADDNDHNYPGYPGLTLLAFSFLDKYEKDQDFFLRDSFLTHKQDTGRSFYTYQKQLQRVCGGLIEWHPYRWSEKTWGRLVWTHRSVPEIFSGDKLKGTMERALGNFNSALAFVRLAYAELLFWRAESSEDYFVYEDIHMVLSLLRRVTEGSYWLMESIDSRIKAMRSQTPESCLCIDLRLPHQRGWRNSWVGCLPPSSPVGFNLLSIFLCCVVFEHHVYVRWKIENDPEALKGLEGTIATHLMLRKGPDFWTWDHATGTNVFTDKTRINFIFHMSDSLGLRWTTTANLTIWERYQLAEFLDCYWPDVRRGSGPFGYIAELFLERGAATDFSVIVKGDSWVDEVVFRFKHVDVILSEIDYHVHTDDMRSAAFPRLRALIQKCERDGQFTLRDWIESSDLENKDRLLQLLDASKESIKSCRPEEVAETGQLRSEAQGDGPNASEKGGLERLEDTTKTEPRPVPETRPAEKAEFWPRVAIVGVAVFVVLLSGWAKLHAREE